MRYSWPAFYVSEGGSVLWVGFGGEVRNGGWKPTFSDDHRTCWADPHGAVFTWAGVAPASGNYNDVIGAFEGKRNEIAAIKRGGQCCNAASRAKYGTCPECLTTASGLTEDQEKLRAAFALVRGRLEDACLNDPDGWQVLGDALGLVQRGAAARGLFGRRDDERTTS